MQAEREHRIELFKREFFAWRRVAIMAAGAVAGFLIAREAGFVWTSLIPVVAALGYCALTAWKDAPKKAFQNPQYRLLWASVKDRLKRFDQAYGGLKANWDEELPVLRARVQMTAEAVYTALRRADVMQQELQKSEGHMSLSDTSPFRPMFPSQDRKVQELYQLADRNVAEYRQRLNAVTAGIQRCEAQTAVFITTLDNLRVRLLGYRLLGKSPEMEHKQFLETIGEAKAQLDAVDQALEEIQFDRLVAQVELDAASAMEAPTQAVAETSSDLRAALSDVTTSPPPLPNDAQVEERNS